MKYIEDSETGANDLGIDLFNESLAFDGVKHEDELFHTTPELSTLTPQFNTAQDNQKAQDAKAPPKLSLLQQTLQEQLVTVDLPSRSQNPIRQDKFLGQELPKQEVHLSSVSVKKHSELAHHLTAPLSPPLTPPQQQQAKLQIQNQPKINLLQQQTLIQQQVPKTQKIIVQQVAQPIVQNSQPQQIIISAQPAVPPPTLQTTLGQLNLQQLQQVCFDY